MPYDPIAPASLDDARTAATPTFVGRGPLRPILIHGAVTALWVVLCLRAFFPHGFLVWSVGLVYVAYDAFLMIFVWLHMSGRGRAAPSSAGTPLPPVAILIAAFNEETVLERSIAALALQSVPPALIIVADDGSTDDTAGVFRRAYGIEAPELGTLSAPAASLPTLRWLRLPHGGKARALNAAIAVVDTPLMLTVDADTRLAPDAIEAMARAFAAEPNLVAATGVLTPSCGPTVGNRLFEFFQGYEYVRNFLSRRAWMGQDSLLLISGAFAGFRRDAVAEVGGFDPNCLVEDYELIHRLRRHGVLTGRGWTTRVLGEARAITSAPGRLLDFLRQRRRWFGGFLQTQYRYRDMIGNPRFGRLGMLMLPVKAIDTMQPIYGLTALAVLAATILTGHLHLTAGILLVIFGKVVLDAAFLLSGLGLYRRWAGSAPPGGALFALLALIAEPFTFQVLRHLGAAWGWVAFFGRSGRWGTSAR
jgi:cellulose synthase/poly-beta-1,6-N-acetylglucosamine synthase-like glycosyltransferase